MPMLPRWRRWLLLPALVLPAISGCDQPGPAAPTAGPALASPAPAVPSATAVEFYVFSPQWSGDIAEIEPDPATERVVEDTRRTRDSVGGKDGVQLHWVTVQARDGSYTRAYYDEFDTGLNVRKAFGIKYRDQAAYTRYRDLYLAFKNSLVQFAD
jgi:hypothetical protein